MASKLRLEERFTDQNKKIPERVTRKRKKNSKNLEEISEDRQKTKMSKIFDFFEKKEKKKSLFGTELEDLVPSDCLIPTVISKERVIIKFRFLTRDDRTAR